MLERLLLPYLLYISERRKLVDKAPEKGTVFKNANTRRNADARRRNPGDRYCGLETFHVGKKAKPRALQRRIILGRHPAEGTRAATTPFTKKQRSSDRHIYHASPVRSRAQPPAVFLLARTLGKSPLPKARGGCRSAFCC